MADSLQRLLSLVQGRGSRDKARRASKALRTLACDVLEDRQLLPWAGGMAMPSAPRGAFHGHGPAMGGLRNLRLGGRHARFNAPAPASFMMTTTPADATAPTTTTPAPAATTPTDPSANPLPADPAAVAPPALSD